MIELLLVAVVLCILIIGLLSSISSVVASNRLRPPIIVRKFIRVDLINEAVRELKVKIELNEQLSIEEMQKLVIKLSSAIVVKK